jgi:hypothetical protein
MIGAGIARGGDAGLFQRVSSGLLNTWMFVFASVRVPPASNAGDGDVIDENAANTGSVEA